jgi:HPr kinase/phosphorylase
MQSNISIRDFHQRYQKRLKLSFASAQVGLDYEISLPGSIDDSYESADYLNIIRPSSVVVIGQRESKYLASLSVEQQRVLFDQLLNAPVILLILSHEANIDSNCIKYISDTNVPVFRSELKSTDLLRDLRYFLNQALADKCTEHGVFIDIHSIGTFITGESGVGKSELALSLISRGHRLIADDVTEFSRISPGVVDGTHPGLSNEFMEVRGLGILNIRAMFGSNSLRRNKNLRMIFNMVNFTPENRHKFDRLGSSHKMRNILGVDIPELTLPVAPGRNLAVLVESAARNHILKMGGYNSAQDFIQRQRLAIQENAEL